MGAYVEAFDGLAKVLTYPGEHYTERVKGCSCSVGRLGPGHEAAAVKLDQFMNAVGEMSTGELEELYTRTFDINPVSSLEVAWHLHGETYERGAFLVQMRDLLRRCRIQESTELPDHITHVLQAVGRMDPSEGSEFISKNFLRALDRMLEGFAGKSNPYEYVLLAVRELLSRYATSHAGV